MGEPLCKRLFRTLILILTMAPAPLGAQEAHDSTAAAADALFRQGREAMKRGDYNTACPKFAESQQLDPAGGTLLNLAECEERLGLLASAWHHYQEAAAVIPSGDVRSAHARRQAVALEPRIPRLTVRLPPDAAAGTRVVQDGIELGPGSLQVALPLDPGKHTVVVTAPGRKQSLIELNMKEGEEQVLDVKLGDRLERPPISSVAAPPSAAPIARGDRVRLGEPRSKALRTAGYVVGGVGVAALGVGTYFAIRAKSKDSDALAYCSGSTCWNQAGVDLTSESRTSSKIAIGSFVGGGVALVGGAALVLMHLHSHSTTRASGMSFAATAGPGEIGLGVEGGW